MRIVDPADVNRDEPLESVMTVILPGFVPDELSSAMRPVDPFGAPGPASIAVLRLDVGPTVVIVHHEAKNELEILAPLDQRVEAALAEVLEALRIPRTAIEWVRDGISLQNVDDNAAKARGISTALELERPVNR